LFSQLKLVKTDDRVNLSVETFEALLLTRRNKIELNDDQVFNKVSETRRLIKYEANQESKQRLLQRKSSEITEKSEVENQQNEESENAI